MKDEFRPGRSSNFDQNTLRELTECKSVQKFSKIRTHPNPQSAVTWKRKSEENCAFSFFILRVRRIRKIVGWLVGFYGASTFVGSFKGWEMTRFSRTSFQVTKDGSFMKMFNVKNFHILPQSRSFVVAWHIHFCGDILLLVETREW